MKQNKETIPNTPNIFSDPKVLNKRYGDMFAEIFNAGLVERYDMMEKVYDTAKNDSSLDDSKKKLVEDCYNSFKYANFMESNCNPLMSFLINKKPNLDKFISHKRFTREIDTLYSISMKSGFKFEVVCFPILLTSTLLMFGYPGIEKQAFDTKEPYHGKLLLALLSRYSRGLAPNDYKGMWFVMTFLQNVSLLSLVNPDILKANPNLSKYASNLFVLIDRIIVEVDSRDPFEENCINIIE